MEINFSQNTLVEGNSVGPDANGLAALFNTVGTAISNSVATLIRSNTISGNNQGVLLFTAGTRLNANLIGTDTLGTGRLPNQHGGVEIAGDCNIIGGSTPAERNIISANGENGIIVFANGNITQGNYIGTDITGENQLGNQKHGIQIGLSANNNIIGGANPGEGNVISANVLMESALIHTLWVTLSKATLLAQMQQELIAP